MYKNHKNIAYICSGPKIFFFNSVSPQTNRLEMHLPNKCFHLPIKFSPDPKLSFIFKSSIFHLPTYKHIFAIKSTNKEAHYCFAELPIAIFTHYINQIQMTKNAQPVNSTNTTFNWQHHLNRRCVVLSQDSICVTCIMGIQQKMENL